MNKSSTTLKPKTKYFGWDYRKNVQLRMTGKEWHIYTKRERFNYERGNDAVTGNACEIWLDGTDINHKKP